MTPRFRGKSKRGSVYVPSTPQHRYADRATGTNDPKLVRRMKKYLVQLALDQQWAPLNAIHERRVRIVDLWDAHVRNAVPELLSRATGAELAAHIEPWLETYRSHGGAANNIGPYRQRVSAFVRPGTRVVDITPARLQRFLTDLDVSSGTRRHYVMALRAFLRYLRTAEVIPIGVDPLAGYKPPKKNKPRRVWASRATDTRIVQAIADPHRRALIATILGTGADVSAIVERALVGDFDLDRGVVIVRGEKTARRDRHAVIEAWAIPYIREGIRHRHPRARAFDGLTRYIAAAVHKRAADDVGALGYQLRDSRHSIAVRWLREGRTVHEVAEQLGTSVWQVTNVYSNQDLTLEERLAGVTATSTATRPDKVLEA